MIFNWHQVAPLFDPDYHHHYTWTELQQFESELVYLAARLRILPLHEALGRLARGSLQGPCAALTFDDGDISVSQYVVPLLDRLGLPATFFINTAYVGVQNAYWFPILSFLSAHDRTSDQAGVPKDLLTEAQELRRTTDPALYNRVKNRLESFASLLPYQKPRLVSAEWLSSLDGEQFAVGAHGHEHQRFSMMPVEWQRNDLAENIRRLSRFRAFRPIFAVPFGRPYDWTQETLRISSEQGMDVVLANGGVNLDLANCYRRNPSDNRRLRDVLADAFTQT